MDMNSYFASCEQHLQPRLRGRPVAVTPVLVDTGCCIAANYAAKARGVRVGCSVRDARRLCPDIEVVKSRPDEYVRLHHALVELTEGCMHVERVCSIDEWVCALTGRWREPERALELAGRIKARLAEFSPVLRCSIGLAPNRWLAKVGSDMRKPDGLMVIREGDLPGVFRGMRPVELCGIGRRMSERLEYYGIDSVEALFALPREHLRVIWGGVQGERFFLQLHGFEVPELETRRSQVGHSRVLPPELRTREGVRAVSSRLLQRACVRLRAEGYLAGRVSLCVGFFDEERWEDSLRVDLSRYTPVFLDVLGRLWGRCPRACGRPNFVAVILGDLEPFRDGTASLFGGDERRLDALAAAMDGVVRRFGSRSVFFGGAMGGIEDGPPRIAFTRIPDLDFE